METKRSTFATSFYIKRSAVRNRDGKAPIMVKISVDGDDKAVGTKLFVTPDLWENGKAKGKSAEANEINGQLKEVSARLTNHYHRILREEDFVTAEKLRNAFLGVGVMENCILKDFGNMNREFEAMVEKGQRAKSTYNKYLAVYNHFKTFLWEKKKRTDMAYKELTKEIIADFDKYLRVEKGLSANTLWIYTMPLLSLTDKAWRRGIVRTDPFGEYSLEMQETDRGYLTEEELRTLANAVFVKKQTSLVRDMFLFGCFTGLSYIDIKTLTHDKIQRMDFDGEEWIITRRTKTRVSSNVPLMEIAKELIERYKGLAGGDLVFPMPSNSVCNRHLKQIAKACGIHKEIGFHVSKQTKPRPLHTESSLLSAMEHCGRELQDDELRDSLKGNGIGTPATRASIIETLFARDYVRREKKSLVPTDKGLAVYQIVKDKRIADVEMTGQWETALAKIESGEMNPDTFRKGIEVYAAQITEELLQVQVSVADGGHIPCPKCRSGRILLYPKVAKCSNVDCPLTVFRNKGEKQLTDSQIADLVTKGKTSLIKGFRSRDGKPFDAYLTFDKDFRIVYGFPPRTDKPKGKERRR